MWSGDEPRKGKRQMGANESMFVDTGLEVVLGNGARVSRLFFVDASAVAWDGALPETNAAIWSDRCESYCYVELVITGKGAKRHAGGVWGTKARIRFTGSEDGAAWLDAVVRWTR